MSTLTAPRAQHSMMSRRNSQGKPVPVLETIHKTGALADVLAQAKHILELDQRLAEWLDEPAKAHCKVASTGPGHLVLEVDSPVWAQRLRFLLPDLSSHFGCNVSFRVTPGILTDRVAPTLRVSISRESAITLEQFAASTDNEALAEIVRRLARHTS